jgi:hypothetical protein
VTDLSDEENIWFSIFATPVYNTSIVACSEFLRETVRQAIEEEIRKRSSLLDFLSYLLACAWLCLFDPLHSA